MSAEQHRRFRSLADRMGLTLQAPCREDRFLIALPAGSLEVFRHPTIVRNLVDLAGQVYGPGNGEHAELLALVALRSEVEDSSTGAPDAIVWRVPGTAKAWTDAAPWITLAAWLEDQFLLDEALLLADGRDDA